MASHEGHTKPEVKTCKHEHLAYCEVHDTPYCKDCAREWLNYNVRDMQRALSGQTIPIGPAWPGNPQYPHVTW